MAGVVLEGVSRIFPGPVAALEDVSLTVRDREFLVLVGPSGSGKTTLLRLIAGLEEVTKGEIRIGERSMARVPPRERDVALVFQDYALYPHLTVRRNLALSLELRWGVRWWRRSNERRREIDQRVQETACTLGIEPLLERVPRQLSGGQRQRVALGRALVRQPGVYLFDEPLSNLDAQLRTSLRRELKQLHRRLAATMIYVTHDQEEALALGDRVAVLSEGRLQQLGTPEEVYMRPRNTFVAGFLGEPGMNFLKGRLLAADGEVRFAARGWSVALDRILAARVQPYLEREVVLGLRPEDVTVSPRGESAGLPARVLVVEPLPNAAVVYVEMEEGAAQDAAATTLVSRTSARARMAAGDFVSMHLDMRQAHVFDPQTGENVGWPRVVEGN
jgi:multiple sugar transport system ATP-binding protein